MDKKECPKCGHQFKTQLARKNYKLHAELALIGAFAGHIVSGQSGFFILGIIIILFSLGLYVFTKLRRKR